MRIPDSHLFRCLREGIAGDRDSSGNFGKAGSCVQQCRDMINIAYINWTDPSNPGFVDPVQLVSDHTEYLEYFPFLRHSSNFPREFLLASIKEPYFFGGTAFQFDCKALLNDKIFEVSVFE
jgi:hypothetical protein